METVSDYLQEIKRKYETLHPETPGLSPGAAAQLWAAELDLCKSNDASGV